MKIISKKLALILVLTVLVLSFTGCSKTDDKEDVVVKVAALKGPTGMGMVDLMEKNSNNESENKYEFSIYGAPDALTGKIINGEVDIAAVPTNLASVLYNKTKGEVQLAAVNTLGVLYVLESGNEINSIEDLKGKKIWVSGKGATPDYALQYILKQNGIDPEKDVEIDFTFEHAELAAAVAAGDVSIALLPQPHVTTVIMKNQNVRIALDLTEEWDKAAGNDSKLAMGAIVVNKEFAKNNKKVVEKFLKEYKTSVEWVNANNTDASVLIQKHEILPKAKLAEIALPKCSIVYIDGDESKEILEGFYQILFNFNPTSLGGKLPDGDFYYKK